MIYDLGFCVPAPSLPKVLIQTASGDTTTMIYFTIAVLLAGAAAMVAMES
jgi:hypothetical protein